MLLAHRHVTGGAVSRAITAIPRSPAVGRTAVPRLSFPSGVSGTDPAVQQRPAMRVRPADPYFEQDGVPGARRAAIAARAACHL